MTITRVQTEALATLAMRLRPDWRHAGIVAAIDKAAATTSDPFDICRALVNLAEEESVKTPALLAGQGPHWRKPSGEVAARRGDHNVHCIEHPAEVVPCRQCAATVRPARADEIRALRAAVVGKAPKAKASTRPHQPEHDLAEARARLDAEAS